MALSDVSDSKDSEIGGIISKLFDVTPGFSAFFKKLLLKERDWAAIIYECDFNTDALRVAQACQEFGYNKAICFNVDYNKNETYELDLTKEDLRQVHNIYHCPSYAINEKYSRFVIISDSDYYWAIAGDPDFIEKISVRSLSEDLEDFRVGITPYLLSEDFHNRSIGEKMLSYCEICKDRLRDFSSGTRKNS